MRMGVVAVPEFVACAWSNVFSIVAEVVGGGLEVRESHFSFLRPDGKTCKSQLSGRFHEQASEGQAAELYTARRMQCVNGETYAPGKDSPSVSGFRGRREWRQ